MGTSEMYRDIHPDFKGDFSEVPPVGWLLIQLPCSTASWHSFYLSNPDNTFDEKRSNVTNGLHLLILALQQTWLPIRSPIGDCGC